MSRYSALNRVVPADTAYSTTPKRVTDNVQLGGGHFQELLQDENDADASFHGHPRDQYRPYVRPADSQPVAWCSPGARPTEPYGSPEPDRHRPCTSTQWTSPQPRTPWPQPSPPSPTAHEQILEHLDEPCPSAGGHLRFTPTAEGERGFLYTQLPWPAMIALGLLGIDLQDAALSACFLTGLGNARMESQLLGQLEVLTYKVALDRRGGSGSGTAAGGCGRHGSLGADPRDQARRDVRNTWSEMHRCGLVKVDKGGVVIYDPEPPLKLPFRVLNLHPSIQKPAAGRCRPTISSYDISLRRYVDTPPTEAKGSATIPLLPNRTPMSPATPLPAAPATPSPQATRPQIVLQPKLLQLGLGSFLTRHPELAARDRLARVDASAVMRDAALEQDSWDDGRKEAKTRAAKAALEALVARGFVFAGRKYMFLLGKEDDLWFLAVKSVLREDLAGWRLPVISHPVRDAWPLLGAAGLLPTVQLMSTRGELWVSPTVPLYLDRRWTVKLVEDLKGRDSITGQEVVLDDGAGRAHPDLWAAMHAAWDAHSAAKDAAAGRAAGSWVTGSAARGCPPVQMRMHIKLCKSRPRVMAKGTLSPDATLPPYTIALPYSCVKAPKGDMLQAWMALAARGDEGGVPAAPDYEAPIVLELNSMGVAVTDARLNPTLALLLEHWGLPKAYLEDLMKDEIQAVKNTVATPEGARRRLRGEEGSWRFPLLRDRIASGWGHSGPDAWGCRDAHLQQELTQVLDNGYDSLRRLRIGMPGGINALGVPDHTRSLGPRQVALVGPSGYTEAGAPPQRALLYRHPGLHSMDLLAVWLVPPPAGLRDGFGPGLQNALVMSTQGGEPMAAQLATGDYDGDQFVLITNPVAVEACCDRLSGAYEEDELRRAADCGEEQAKQQQRQQQQQQQQQSRADDSGNNCVSSSGGSSSSSSSGGDWGSAGSGDGVSSCGQGPPSWDVARTNGQLWCLKPRVEGGECQEHICVQMVQFLVHAEACQVAVGSSYTMWCKWVEVPEAREGGVGGPRCSKLSQMYADCLDARKHPIVPQASHEMQVMTKDLQLPCWHELQWRKGLRPGPSAASALFKLIPGREQLQREAGLQLTAAALQPDERLVARAVKALPSPEMWAPLVEACGQVFDREWNRPWWGRKLAEESRAAAGAAGPRRSNRDAQRQEAGETDGFKLSLVEAVRRELIRAGRACGLDGHLQLGQVTDDPTRGDDLNLGHRLALAAAFYTAVYDKRRSRLEAAAELGLGAEGQGGAEGEGQEAQQEGRCKDQDHVHGKAGVVWEVAGEELNTLYRLVTFGGRLRTAAPWWP